ncbi:MAG: flavin reductase family protein [Lachnospiraceae bacterium]|nr:flavin reductase family protein [Lachnospiraceae bacterium]
MAKEIWKPGNLLNPVPAVMLSCARPGEKPNIITVAWTGTVCSEPPMLSVAIRPDRYSHGIIRETGEFVLNLTSARLVKAADLCGVRSGRDTDKFREARLTPGEAPHMNLAPSIAESPVSLECRVTQILPLGCHDLFLAEIVGVLVDDSLIEESGRLRLDKADLTAYMHGRYYRLGEELGTYGYSVRRKPPAKPPAAPKKKSAPKVRNA